MWLFLLNVVAIFIQFANSDGEFHSSSGPWVLPTSGEIWPLPVDRTLQDTYFHIEASNFQFKVTGHTCDILQDLVTRYSRIIAREAEIAKRSVITSLNNGGRRKPDSNYKGVLSGLEIRLETPCERIPHLKMNELYILEIDESTKTAKLSSDAIWGIIRGIETFAQILTPSKNGSNLKVRCQRIVDWPHLPHRGLLIDTSRHYLPVSDIFLTLDAMAYNKLNVLHWHIVDDNSFPYESKTYPQLSLKGAYHPLMVYTFGDVQDIIEYARLRGIRVMPEFDTPGHTKSWGLAFPELLTDCYGSDGKPDGTLGPINPIKPEVYTFMSRLISEVAGVFSDKYLHIGGDEVPFDCWASNPDISSFMKNNNISKNYTKLEEIYISRLLNITNSIGTSSIVWQEVFNNGVRLPTDTVVHVWTGDHRKELADATKAGHPVLLSACWYLDHLASGGDWQKFYICDPLDYPGADETRKLMLGGEACMWAEFVDRTNVHSRIWPRASATAERLWSHRSQQIKVAAKRLEEHSCRMNRRGVPAQPPNGPGFCVI